MKRITLRFENEAAAIADSVIGQYWIPPSPPGHPEDPDYRPGAWRPDIISTGIAVTKSGVALDGFWMMISRPDNDTACCGHLCCQVAWDDDSAKVLGGQATCEDVALMWISPMPAGSYNPFPLINSPPPPEP